ncbi:MAG: preprotein translocase subunit YajC [Phycisphaerae bacterium]|nr:MAG: preprotein translocase subunit YajC [Planctomycetota bacterium]KAB2942428.1 MAG: preprotein translocase subunit YajC [Phycisphaerae bacterium]MBE7458408.1 preprotein translocase subunit YajC [Planctomycetia bacterium]MCK6465221.1 preprotein translocase subunit YajC [Phycisphaerae bacterium]MCL4718783.1 preprotein translocase subunit YajC [Phycisphaerae bacterium]
MISLTELLAQTESGAAEAPQGAPPSAATTTAPGGTPPPKPGAPDTTFIMFFGLMIALMVFMMVSRSKREKREREARKQLLDNLAKNDRVMTIGGVVGTVVAVKESTVVLKVDESTNTRMTFARRAIQQVLAGDEEPKLEETR